MNLKAMIAIAVLSSSTLASADLRPDRVFTASERKNGHYIRDGLVVGGDRAINEVVVKDIRRAANAGFERIVVDLQGNHNGETAAIDRPPYYQVSITPDEKRLVFSVFGKPTLALDSKKILAAFKKSKVVQRIALLPPIDPNVWTFVAELKTEHPVEVFELANPVRIIVDIQEK
jgi:hypothetical protein